jgi:hypothetical protein
MRREATDTAEQSERPRTFGERRLGNVRSDRSGANMLSVRHGFMVTSLILTHQFWLIIYLRQSSYRRYA